MGSFHFLGTVTGVEGRGGLGHSFSGYCDWSGGERGGWVIPFSGYCDWSGGERGVGSFHFLATVMDREMGVSPFLNGRVF